MCPISFKIYGMKLNKVLFSSENAITYFLDKPYQETNFKGHLNNRLLSK